MPSPRLRFQLGSFSPFQKMWWVDHGPWSTDLVVQVLPLLELMVCVWLSPSRPQVPYSTPVLCHCSGWQSAAGFYWELLRNTVAVRAGVVEQGIGGFQYSLFSTVYYLSWPLGCFWMKWKLFCGRPEMWISIHVYDRDEQITRRICFWLWLAWVLSGSWEVQDHISQNGLPYSPLMSEYF